MDCAAGFLILAASCSILQLITQANDKNEFYLQRKHATGLIDAKRSKRAIYTIGAAVLRGLKATAELLQGAKKIQPKSKYEKSRVKSRNVQYYEKPGTYATAMEDFFSVNPTDIKEIGLPQKYRGLLGTVGDRSVSIRDNGPIDGKPQLNIVRTLPSQQYRVDKIIYRD